MQVVLCFQIYTYPGGTSNSLLCVFDILRAKNSNNNVSNFKHYLLSQQSLDYDQCFNEPYIKLMKSELKVGYTRSYNILNSI